jgi:hypothetical protein
MQVANSKGHRPFGEADSRVAGQANARPLCNWSFVTHGQCNT